jgi:nucleotide-binding universal stress UspA family protein
MMMFDQVLVPLDGSPTAESVLEPLLQLIDGHPTTLELLLAISPDFIGLAELPGAVGATAIHTAEIIRPLEDAGRAYLGRTVAKIAREGLRLRTRVELAIPAVAILDASMAVDLIAMTTHGFSGLTRWMLGSVAERVLAHATVPVLLVGPAYEATARTEQSTRPPLLVATDGSGPALAATDCAGRLAAAQGRSIVVLAVTHDDQGSVQAAESALNVTCAHAERQGVAVTAVLRTGEPGIVIADHARSIAADVIVMGTFGRQDLARWVMGSTTAAVLKHARQPLLLLRQARVHAATG